MGHPGHRGLIALDLIEGGRKWGEELAGLLEQVMSRASVTLYCDDLFAHEEALVRRIKGLFRNAIYLYHSEMSSCEAISAQFGKIAVIHPSTVRTATAVCGTTA